MNKLIRPILAGAVLGLLQISAAHATPATYTFTGTGTVDVNGSPLSGTSFSVVFTGDTTAIANGAPFFRLFNVPGTFTDGSFTATLTAGQIVAVSTTSLINFYNPTFTDNGLGGSNPALGAYDLSTSIGPIDETAFQNDTFNALGHGFVTGASDNLEFMPDDVLASFTAQVPEPASLVLFGAALVSLGLVRRRKRKTV